MRHHNLRNAAVVLLLVSALILLFSFTHADVDLWGHLRYGLDNLQARSVAQSDQYSYLSAGQRWINHEWLAEVIFAAVWKVAGIRGLVLLKVLLGLAAAGVAAAGMARGGAHLFSGAIYLVIGSTLLFFDLGMVRPQLFTVAGFAVVLFVILEADSGRQKWLWLLPPLFLLWANLHGGFLAGFAILMAWAAAYLFRKRSAILAVSLPLALAAVATLVNPYGLALIALLLRTATVPRPEIWEWNPVELTGPFGLLYMVVMAIAVSGLAFSRRKHSVPLTILFAGMALAPFSARRHIALFGVTALMIAGPHVTDAFARWREGRAARPVPVWLAVLSGITATVLAGLAIWNTGRIRLLPGMPVNAVALAKSIPAFRGNMVTSMAWGEYVLWHVGPRIQVSIDGRRETLYSPRVYQQHLELLFGAPGWQAVLDQYPADLALLPLDSPAFSLLLMKTDWSLIYKDGVAALFARRGRSAENVFREAAARFVPPPASGVFP